MAILLLNRFKKEELNILQWFKDFEEEIYMITTDDAAKDYDEFPVLISLPTLLNNGRVEVEIEKLYQTHPFRLIIALEETDIIRAGVIRDRFNLQGQSLYSAKAFRNKFLMKKIAKEGGINVPEFKNINSPFDILDFIKEYDYPIILKPKEGMASRGISVINEEGSLTNWLENNSLNNYMIEKYESDSDVFHIDGIYMNNEIIFCCASRYLIPLIQYSLNNGSGSILINEESKFFIELKNFVKKVLEVLPTPPITTFHAEVFYNKKNGQYKLCEIASRTIGGKAVELIKHSYGIDLDRYITRAQCGFLDPIHNKSKTLSACFFVPPGIGYLIEIPKPPSFRWCINFNCYGVLNRYYNGPQKVLDHYIYFLVEGETEEELEDRIQKVLLYIEENSKWSL